MRVWSPGRHVTKYGYFSCICAMLSPWLSLKMAGSATPWITLPFSIGSFCSASRMRLACMYTTVPGPVGRLRLIR